MPELNLYWVPIGYGVVVLLLVLLLVRLLKASHQKKVRKSLGLPLDSKLAGKDAQAFHAFEDTDLKLRKTYPKMPDAQRQAIARDLLRDKGVLRKKKKAR